MVLRIGHVDGLWALAIFAQGAEKDLDRRHLGARRALVEACGNLGVRFRFATRQRHGKFPVLRLPLLDGVGRYSKLLRDLDLGKAEQRELAGTRTERLFVDGRAPGAEEPIPGQAAYGASGKSRAPYFRGRCGDRTPQPRLRQIQDSLTSRLLFERVN